MSKAKSKKSGHKSTEGMVAPMVDKKWMAQNDARTLVDARVIMSDPKRMKAAAQEAKKLAGEKMKEAKAMSSIARRAK